ncbi:amino acid adenylation domain-containing protein ['Paenibacillus yunnanensis' Narsing Rao et al. 2020]|uniref:amino acid adenylation domain-containing protein n=1 Tax=Paenibacillus tengchongensis TaxID=2608684 RepID=UPI00124CCEA3|nr:amino acid adenylation domain-containing protein [Paenibacillus tengchongensis]
MKTFIDLLNSTALEKKYKSAIITTKERLTYGELITCVKERAAILVRLGVKKDTIVGIVTDESLEVLINIMAVIFSGAAYLPIDEKVPTEKLHYIISDAKLDYLIINKTFNLNTVNMFTIHIINCEVLNEVYRGEVTQILPEREPDDMMYIMYTSGSTGYPKGVIIEDQSFNTFLDAINDVLEFEKYDARVLASTSFTFDISILETLVSLAYGATCILVNRRQKLNPKLLRDIMLKEKVNVLQFTPTYLQFFLDYFDTDLQFFQQMRKLLIGGEKFPEVLIGKLYRYTKADIYNCYGPTEATIWATAARFDPNKPVSIGNSLRGYNVFIDQKEANESLTGEICIGGPAVARGYLNKKELTQKHFFINEKGSRLYRTGDLGRMNENDELEICGRLDRQVKIKGFRVELDEIEKTIERCISNISRAAVILTETNLIVCFYQAEEQIEREKIIDSLKKQLSDYMIPIIYIWKKSLPVMINGKLNYTELKLDAGIHQKS